MFAQMCGHGRASSLGRGCGAGKFLLRQRLGDSAPAIPALDFPHLEEDQTPGSIIPGSPSLCLALLPSFQLPGASPAGLEK